jgi:hypothetical protein
MRMQSRGDAMRLGRPSPAAFACDLPLEGEAIRMQSRGMPCDLADPHPPHHLRPLPRGRGDADPERGQMNRRVRSHTK